MVRDRAKWWDKKTLWYIMKDCVILHNMIMKDEVFDYENEDTETLSKEDFEHRDPLLLSKFPAILAD